MSQDHPTDNPGDRSRIHPARVRAVAGVLVMPAAGLPGPALGWSDMEAWVRRSLAREAEQRRLFPWTPVFFGLGILLFFAAEGRPSLWAPVAACAASVTAAVALRRS